jgi:D-alanyl-D-alanine carboxypeptidase-like protein
MTDLNKKQAIILRYRILISVIVVVGLVFGYFYFFNQFWTHKDTSNFKSLIEYTGEYNQSHIRGYRGTQILVHETFLPVIHQVDAYAARHDVNLIITQSYRSPVKTVKDAVVTPAVRSNHLAGHAIDFNFVDGIFVYESKDLMRDKRHELPENMVRFINDIRQDETLRWGGDFQTQDPIHIDDGINIDDPDAWARQFKGCFADYDNAVPKWEVWLKRVFK